MTKDLFSRRRLGITGALAVLLTTVAAGPALAETTTPGWGSSYNTSACSDPSLSQPFVSNRDSNWYTLVPGQSTDNFDGAGWTLLDGAALQSTQLVDGATGSVLDLPSGSQAISPPMCVSSDYPTARTLVRNVTGGEGVQIYVSYAGTKTEAKPKGVGQVHGQQSAWTASNPFNVQPGNLPGWQLVRFTLIPGGKTSDFQIYNFYVDPRMKG